LRDAIEDTDVLDSFTNGNKHLSNFIKSPIIWLDTYNYKKGIIFRQEYYSRSLIIALENLVYDFSVLITNRGSVLL
jgi:hypothetical protein